MSDAACPPAITVDDIRTFALLVERESTVAGMRRGQSASVEVPIDSEDFQAECFYQLARILEAEFSASRDQLAEGLCKTSEVFENWNAEPDTLFPIESNPGDGTAFILWLSMSLSHGGTPYPSPVTFSSRCTRVGVPDRFNQLARLLENELSIDGKILTASLRYVATVLQEQNGELAPKLPHSEAMQRGMLGNGRNGITLSLYPADHDRIRKLSRLIEDRNGGRRVSESEAVRVAIRSVSLEDRGALLDAYRAMHADDGRRRKTAGKR